MTDLHRLGSITAGTTDVLSEGNAPISLDALERALAKRDIIASPFEVREAVWRLVDSRQADIRRDGYVVLKRANMNRLQPSQAAKKAIHKKKRISKRRIGKTPSSPRIAHGSTATQRID